MYAGASDLEECQTYCIDNEPCFAIEFEATALARTRCFLHTSRSTLQYSEIADNTDRYVLVRCTGNFHMAMSMHSFRTGPRVPRFALMRLK